MKKNFGIVSNFVVFLMIISLASACKTPVVYNNYGVPVSLFGGGELEIKYSDYPPDAVVIDYTMSVKNTNSQGLTLNFIPSPSLSGFVSPTTISLEPNEQKEFNLPVNIAGTDKSGDLYVQGNCADTSPITQGVIYVYIKGRGSVVSCSGRDDDCGMPGMCEDVGKYDGCYDGYFRDYFCGGNTKQFNPRCTSYCCGLVGGTCKGSPSICSVPRFSINLPVNITNETGKPKSATVTLHQPGTSVVVNTTTINGYGIIASPNVTVDVSIEYDSSVLNIVFRNFNISKLTGSLKMTLDDVSTTIPNATLLKAYSISTSLSSFDGVLKFMYSGLPFVNEQGLAIYKCSSFNKTSNTCNGNWVKMSITRYPTDDVVSTEITSFSVYALGESQITTTTTTTATTTTTSGSSSNNDNSDSGSRYSGGGRYTTTTIRTTTTLVECTCDSWSNLACGEIPCDQTQMKQQRTCNPSGCNLESQCVVDNSCNVVETNQTEDKLTSNKPTGFFVFPDLSQYVYPISGLIILTVTGIAIWRYNDRIRDVFPSYRPSYKISSGKSSKKGNVTVDVQTPKYLEVKIAEKPKVEVIKPVEQPRINTEARNKSIDEMRKRALEMDKKMKRK
jgi:hypothetical protein